MRNIIKRVTAYLLVLSILITSFTVSTEEIIEAATHTHSDACYEGHNHTVNSCIKHVHSGSASSYGGCYRGSANYSTGYYYHSHSGGCYSNGGSVYSSNVQTGTAPDGKGGTIYYSTHYFTCGICGGGIGSRSWVTYSNGSTSCTSDSVSTHSHQTCGYSSGQVTGSYQYISSYNLSCGFTSGEYECKLPNDSTLVCDKVVTSLTPTSLSQVINAGDSIDLSASATFLDGHTENVTCTQTGLNLIKYNVMQSVVLHYGSYTNTAKNPVAFQSTIQVTINGYFDLVPKTEAEEKGYVTEKELHVLCGSERSVTATANMGYTFEGWYDGETKVSSDATYLFSMPAKDFTIEARFTANKYNLNVYTNTPSKGTVEVVNGNGDKSYKENVGVLATPYIGYSFIGWYQAEYLLSTDSLYNFEMPYNELLLEGRFVTNNYNLNVDTPDPLRGSIEVVGGSGSKPYDSEVAVQAIANNSYVFIGWYDGENLVSSSALYAFSMPAHDWTLTARFKQFTGVSVEFSHVFTETYSKEPYFYESGYDVTQNITLTKDMVTVYAYYDMGDREVVQNENFSFVNNRIYKVGINEIKVQVTVNNLSLVGGGAEAIGFYESLSKSLDEIMIDLGIIPGDYVGLKDVILEMNSDLTLYRQTINAIKDKIQLSLEDGTDSETLKSELTIVLNEVSKLYNRMTSLEAALDTAFENYDVDLTDANDIKTAILTLKNDLADANLLVQYLQNEIIMKTLTLEETEAEIVKNQLLLTKTTAENELLVSEITTMQEEKTALENDYITKIALIEQLKQIIINNDIMIGNLQTSVTKITTTIQVTSAEDSSLALIKSELDQLQVEQLSLKTRLVELEEKYNLSLSTYEQLQFEIIGLKESDVLTNEDIITMTQVNVTEQTSTVTKESSLELSTILLMLEDANSKLSVENNKMLK